MSDENRGPHGMGFVICMPFVILFWSVLIYWML